MDSYTNHKMLHDIMLVLGDYPREWLEVAWARIQAYSKNYMGTTSFDEPGFIIALDQSSLIPLGDLILAIAQYAERLPRLWVGPDLNQLAIDPFAERRIKLGAKQ